MHAYIFILSACPLLHLFLNISNAPNSRTLRCHQSVHTRPTASRPCLSVYRRDRRPRRQQGGGDGYGTCTAGRTSACVAISTDVQSLGRRGPPMCRLWPMMLST